MWFFKNQKNKKDVRPYVSVRLEAIGGQGANSAGKILAEAAVLGHHYTGNHFSSFGSEKRGSPVKSFVRFSPLRKPIRTASAINHPDVLVVFHESLIFSHPEVLNGTNENTDIVINSEKSLDDIIFPENIKYSTLTVIDATAIAVKNKCGLNAVMLGALSRVCYEIDESVLKETLNTYFGHLSAEVRKNNLSGFEQGLKKTSVKSFNLNQKTFLSESVVLPEMGWLNAPLGGVIINPGNSVLKDHSASRKGVAPKLIKEICFNCGFCDMVCPDYCFVWEIDASGESAPELQGIDYQYCKGCQKCITVCPVQALTPVAEDQLTEDDKIYRVFPDLDPKVIENQWKKFDWAHYVEELSIKNQMMTLQTELLDPKSYIRPDFPEDVFLKSKKEPSK